MQTEPVLKTLLSGQTANCDLMGSHSGGPVPFLRRPEAPWAPLWDPPVFSSGAHCPCSHCSAAPIASKWICICSAFATDVISLTDDQTGGLLGAGEGYPACKNSALLPPAAQNMSFHLCAAKSPCKCVYFLLPSEKDRNLSVVLIKH